MGEVTSEAERQNPFIEIANTVKAVCHAVLWLGVVPQNLIRANWLVVSNVWR